MGVEKVFEIEDVRREEWNANFLVLRKYFFPLGSPALRMSSANNKRR